MQAVHQHGNDAITHPGYNLYRTGVRIAVVKSSYFVIVLYQPERLITVAIVVRGCKIRITSAYIPNKNKVLSPKKRTSTEA